MMLAVFARPWLMRLAMAMGRLTRASRLGPVLAVVLPGKLAMALRMLESTRPALSPASYEPDAKATRGTFALLTGCVMEGLYAGTNAATSRTLRVNGYAECSAKGQACCGALHAHAGDVVTARKMAKRNIAAFERSKAAFVVSNAAGCGAMLKEYGHLLAGEPEWAERAQAVSHRARDVSELLATAGPLPGGKVDARVTYDAPCHLLHAQRISAPPLKVLSAIPGVTLLPLADADQCCGAAGIYNLLEPGTSAAVLEPKLLRIAETGAEFVATGNPGCLMQIGAGLRREGSPVRAIHPIDLLDAAYGVAFGRDQRP